MHVTRSACRTGLIYVSNLHREAMSIYTHKRSYEYIYTQERLGISASANLSLIAILKLKIDSLHSSYTVWHKSLMRGNFDKFNKWSTVIKFFISKLFSAILF